MSTFDYPHIVDVLTEQCAALRAALAASERALEIARKEIVSLSAENGRLRIIALASP